MEYRTLWVVRHVMPDDRLAHAKVDPDGTITLAVRYGHIHPALLHKISVYSETLSGVGLFDLDPQAQPAHPDVQAWFERVEERFTDNQPLKMYCGGRMPMFFNFLVRQDMAGEEFIREMNYDMLPDVVGRLRLKGRVDLDG